MRDNKKPLKWKTKFSDKPTRSVSTNFSRKIDKMTKHLNKTNKGYRPFKSMYT